MIYIYTSKFQADLTNRLDVLLSVARANRVALAAMAKQLDLLVEYHIQIDERMRTMQRAWDDLVAQVAALTDLKAAVKAGFEALEAKLASAIDQLGNSPSVAEVDALKANVAQAVADIKAAVPANT